MIKYEMDSSLAKVYTNNGQDFSAENSKQRWKSGMATNIATLFVGEVL